MQQQNTVVALTPTACDTSQVFDMDNYWHLFNKLFDDNIPHSVVRLLSFWYSNQKVAVLWHKTLSESLTTAL